MDIQIIAVGKIKERYLNQGINEYLKRLKSYAKVSIVEVKDEATDDQMTQAQIDQVLEKEAERIHARLDSSRHLVVLAIEGDLISSEDLAKKLDHLAIYGKSKVTFLIGGSLGLAEQLKRQAAWRISFGRITLPHQLMRLVLVEQIYRSFRINAGHAYHK